MIDEREIVRRAAGALIPPEPSFDRLLHRRDRMQRNRRIRAGALGIAVAIAVGWLGFEAIRSAPTVPADQSSEQLGIFADVRGWIAYGDRSGIWALDPAGPGRDRVLLSPGEAYPIAWSSDGSKLLIKRGDPGCSDQDDDLVVLNPDGTETVLVDGGVCGPYSGGSFTPDGSKVVYAVTSWDQDGQLGIYVVGADGSSPQPLYAAGDMWVFSPTLSPDGARIAYFEGRGDSGNSLWVMNADGTDRHQILGHEEQAQYGHVNDLAWSADGSRLAFGTGDAVWIVGADGTGLTEVPAYQDLGDRYWGAASRWSPTGSRLAFEYYPGIWVVDGDGSERRQVAASGRWPVWSLDGSRIAYCLDAGTVATMRSDGSDVQTIGVAGPCGPRMDPGFRWNPLPPSPAVGEGT